MSHHNNDGSKEFLDTLLKLIGDFMSTLADNIVLIPQLQTELATLQQEVTALQAAVAALPTTASSDAATLTAVAGVQTTVDAIHAELTPTPAA